MSNIIDWEQNKKKFFPLVVRPIRPPPPLSGRTASGGTFFAATCTHDNDRSSAISLTENFG